MLEIRGLRAEVNGVEVLKGVDLAVNAGETHAIMGPTAPARAPSPMFSPDGPATRLPPDRSSSTGRIS